MRKTRKRPVYPLLYVLLILRPIKPLILTGSWFPQTLIQRCQERIEQSPGRHYNILHGLPLRQSRVDLMTF